MQRRGPLTLPRELEDAVIDHCHDKRTIIACSLVDRSWLFASRRQTFFKVSLNPDNIKSFFELLRSPFCTIRPFISRLELHQSFDAGFRFHRIVPRLAELPSVRHLLLQGLGRSHGDFNRGLDLAFRDNFSAITNLEIYLCFCQSVAEFGTILGAFPKINRLVLGSVAITDKQLPLPSQPRLLCHLKTLIIKSSNLANIVRWLLSHEQLPPINTLHLYYHSSTSINNKCLWNEFIIRLGSSLEHLRLDNACATDHDLSHNTSLRSIHINFRQDELASDLSSNYFSSFISTIQSSQVEIIVLESMSPFGEAIFYKNIDWASLDDSFSRPQFTNLQKIEFRLTDRFMSSLIVRKLPRCETRGLLRFMGSFVSTRCPFPDQPSMQLPRTTIN